MKRICTVAVVAIAVAAFAGCASSLRDAEKATPKGNAFQNALAKDYLAMAKAESSAGDPRAADVFARRSIAAGEGKTVLPDNFENRKVSNEGELSAARQRLVTVLDANGGTMAPDVSARTQVLFDCWVEKDDDRGPKEELNACRDGFNQSLKALEDYRARAQVPMVR